MKKKTVANIIMIVIILAIAISGISIVAYVRGWTNPSDKNAALLTDFRGIITLERDGFAYTATEDTLLRKGDEITCEPGATVTISTNDGYVTLGQGANAIITNPSSDEFTLIVENGEAFVDTVSSIKLEFDGNENELKDCVASLSVRKGAQSISVFYGSVNNAGPGQMLEWINNELSVRDFSVNSLNDFNISQIRKANNTRNMVFSNSDLENLEEQRKAQLYNTATDTPETTKSLDSTAPEATTKVEKNTKPVISSNPVNPTENERTTEAEKNTKPEEPTKNEQTTVPENTTQPNETQAPLTCTLTIRCDTILNNRNELDPAKASYVPENGCILPTITVEFTKGETVFDVLNRACRQYGIQLEYSWTPLYNSYYVEGINNLYEFDCGMESGWMYKVNGWFPNYGCSSYYLTGGESIVWCYTCKGLGEDVGAQRW